MSKMNLSPKKWPKVPNFIGFSDKSVATNILARQGLLLVKTPSIHLLQAYSSAHHPPDDGQDLLIPNG
jgi:hypothetical protein